ncbi:MAG: GNAT family N-acetyltransferase [Promethearchaeota archaeon]|jgi:RimJ/RimL family protein N-acetyltransferase
MKDTRKNLEESFPFIEGKRIDLVTQDSKWIPLFCKWNNDPTVRYYARWAMPTTPEDIKGWFTPRSGGGARDVVFFSIFHKKDKRPIGSIGFFRINWLNRNAHISATIGEPEYWGKGIVGEAANLLIRYGFTELNLHKIYAQIFNPNRRSLRAAEKLGFKPEGVLKEDFYIDGEYVDTHQFGILKSNWIKEND